MCSIGWDNVILLTLIISENNLNLRQGADINTIQNYWDISY